MLPVIVHVPCIHCPNCYKYKQNIIIRIILKNTDINCSKKYYSDNTQIAYITHFIIVVIEMEKQNSHCKVMWNFSLCVRLVDWTTEYITKLNNMNVLWHRFNKWKIQHTHTYTWQYRKKLIKMVYLYASANNGFCLMANVEKCADLSRRRHWKWIDDSNNSTPVFVLSWRHNCIQWRSAFS